MQTRLLPTLKAFPKGGNPLWVAAAALEGILKICPHPSFLHHRRNFVLLLFFSHSSVGSEDDFEDLLKDFTEIIDRDLNPRQENDGGKNNNFAPKIIENGGLKEV